MRNDCVLLTARGKAKGDVVQKWVTPSEAETLARLYQRDGYKVTLIDVRSKANG